MRNPPPKKISKERDKSQISLGSYDRELGLQIFLIRDFEKPKHHRIFSPREREREREREMAKTVAPTMRTDFGRDLCERKGGSKHGVGKTLDHNEARSPRFLSLVRILPAENQNRGFEKAGGSEQESICFLFFPPEFWGKKQNQQKKQKRQSRHI